MGSNNSPPPSQHLKHLLCENIRIKVFWKQEQGGNIKYICMPGEGTGRRVRWWGAGDTSSWLGTPRAL